MLRANEPASGALSDDQSLPDAPLQLPTAQEVAAGQIRAVSLEQAIAIAFRNNPNLEIQRNQIAAQAATVASLSGAYWPTISVFADAEGFQSGSSTYSPYDNNTYGFGPMFAAQGQGENVALTKNGSSVSNAFAGPFYVPAGGSLDVVANGVEAEAGLQLNYAVIDFARTPRVEQQKQGWNNLNSNTPTSCGPCSWRSVRRTTSCSAMSSWCASAMPWCAPT